MTITIVAERVGIFRLVAWHLARAGGGDARRLLTLLFVTHDRRFLDRLATRVVELDRGRLASFPGSFAAYQSRKEALLADASYSSSVNMPR